MPGWKNQKTGDWGQHQVASELSHWSIVSGKVDPDLGEDLRIELSGYEASATGSHPKEALLQVKTINEDCHKDVLKIRAIKKKKLMRWSTQLLPVFIIGVSGFSSKRPGFFMISVDEFLDTRFPGVEIRDIPNKSVTVTARKTVELSSSISKEIETFHKFANPDLSSVSIADKRNEYFEIIHKSQPDPIAGIVQPVSWKILWKSPQRPAFFAAMINDLQRQASTEYTSLPSPAYISFHIYRSQFDIDKNMAVSRVRWIDENHDSASHAIKAINKPNPFVENIETDSAFREFIESRTSDGNEFVNLVKHIAPQFDRIAKIVLNGEQDGLGKDVWTDDLNHTLDQLDRLWDSTPLAPTEFNTLQRVLDNYMTALSGHQSFSGHSPYSPDAEHERYRLETAEEIQYYFGAWWVFLKHSGWEFPYYPITRGV